MGDRRVGYLGPNKNKIPIIWQQRLARVDSANNPEARNDLPMQPLGLLDSSMAAGAVAPAAAATTDADVAPGASAAQQTVMAHQFAQSAASLGPMGSGVPMNIHPAGHELTNDGTVALEILGATSGVAPSQVQ